MHVAANVADTHVQRFCSTVAPNGVAVSLACRPLAGVPDNECVVVVPAHVARSGGSQVLGWAIWERPGVFIEAEFHSVWKSPEGELVDVVPHMRPFAEITFLTDPVLKYHGRQIDNIRHPLVKDNDVTRYLYLFRRRFELTNAGSLATQHGVISLSKRAEREYRDLMKELARLQVRLDKRYGP